MLLALIKYSPRTRSGSCGFSRAMSFIPSSRCLVTCSFKYLRVADPPIMATLSTRSWSIWSSFFGEVSRSIAADDSRVIPEAGCGSTTGEDDMLMSGTSDSSFTSVFTEVVTGLVLASASSCLFSGSDIFVRAVM